MSDGNKFGWLTRFFKTFLLSPVNIIFAIALAWFAFRAYMVEPTLTNKLIVYGIAGLWIFWIVARYMIILFVVIALLGGGYYAYYQYSTREIRKCEAAGGEWNKETKTCEAKKTFLEKMEKQASQFVDSMSKLMNDILSPKTETNSAKVETKTEAEN